jgi:hypothetical protein
MPIQRPIARAFLGVIQKLQQCWVELPALSDISKGTIACLAWEKALDPKLTDNSSRAFVAGPRFPAEFQ